MLPANTPTIDCQYIYIINTKYSFIYWHSTWERNYCCNYKMQSKGSLCGSGWSRILLSSAWNEANYIRVNRWVCVGGRMTFRSPIDDRKLVNHLHKHVSTIQISTVCHPARRTQSIHLSTELWIDSILHLLSTGFSNTTFSLDCRFLVFVLLILPLSVFSVFFSLFYIILYVRLDCYSLTVVSFSFPFR